MRCIASLYETAIHSAFFEPLILGAAHVAASGLSRPGIFSLVKGVKLE